jgi:hypothetical protein
MEYLSIMRSQGISSSWLSEPSIIQMISANAKLVDGAADFRTFSGMPAAFLGMRYF